MQYIKNYFAVCVAGRPVGWVTGWCGLLPRAPAGRGRQGAPVQRLPGRHVRPRVTPTAQDVVTLLAALVSPPGLSIRVLLVTNRGRAWRGVREYRKVSKVQTVNFVKVYSQKLKARKIKRFTSFVIFFGFVNKPSRIGFVQTVNKYSLIHQFLIRRQIMLRTGYYLLLSILPIHFSKITKSIDSILSTL